MPRADAAAIAAFVVQVLAWRDRAAHQLKDDSGNQTAFTSGSEVSVTARESVTLPDPATFFIDYHSSFYPHQRVDAFGLPRALEAAKLNLGPSSLADFF
jgi:hypothetical protein